MEIQLNGAPYTVPDGCTIADLLALRGVGTDGTAVACNDAVVRKARYADTVLQAGDRVEVISAVAGG
jgi:sulfur carrier protein